MADLQPPAEGAVADTEVLYRRVTHTMADSKDGVANSSAFKTNHPDGVSTEAALYKTKDECLAGGKLGMGLVSIVVARARELGVTVVRDPADPSHVLLQGGKAFAKKLAAASEPVPGYFPFDPGLT